MVDINEVEAIWSDFEELYARSTVKLKVSVADVLVDNLGIRIWIRVIFPNNEAHHILLSPENARKFHKILGEAIRKVEGEIR